MRIIASMTTIPSRIDHIRPVIDAILSQTVAVDRIEINTPYVCQRDERFYDIPPWLEEADRVSIFRTDDYGPITKIAPTLLRHKDDDSLYVWSVDDDCVYPPNHLELLHSVHSPDKRRILTRYGVCWT